jgi:hypothetical protein
MLSAIIASADSRKYERKPGCRNAANATGLAGVEVEAFMELLGIPVNRQRLVPRSERHDESGKPGYGGALVDVNAYGDCTTCGAWR